MALAGLQAARRLLLLNNWVNNKKTYYSSFYKTSVSWSFTWAVSLVATRCQKGKQNQIKLDHRMKKSDFKSVTVWEPTWGALGTRKWDDSASQLTAHVCVEVCARVSSKLFSQIWTWSPSAFVTVCVEEEEEEAEAEEEEEEGRGLGQNKNRCFLYIYIDTNIKSEFNSCNTILSFKNSWRDK